MRQGLFRSASLVKHTLHGDFCASGPSAGGQVEMFCFGEVSTGVGAPRPSKTHTMRSTGSLLMRRLRVKLLHDDPFSPEPRLRALQFMPWRACGWPSKMQGQTRPARTYQRYRCFAMPEPPPQFLGPHSFPELRCRGCPEPPWPVGKSLLCVYSPDGGRAAPSPPRPPSPPWLIPNLWPTRANLRPVGAIAAFRYTFNAKVKSHPHICILSYKTTFRVMRRFRGMGAT